MLREVIMTAEFGVKDILLRNWGHVHHFLTRVKKSGRKQGAADPKGYGAYGAWIADDDSVKAWKARWSPDSV